MLKAILAISIFLTLLFDSYAFCKVFMTRDEALKSVFSEADRIVKETIFITQDQAKEIEEIAKAKLDTRLYVLYEGKKKGESLGYAVIDTHRMRTKTETVLVVINPDGTHRLTEILAFFEPPEFMPSDNWIDLFQGKSLGDSLWLGKDIPNITGATITSNAMLKSIRTVLAIFQVVVKGKN